MRGICFYSMMESIYTSFFFFFFNFTKICLQGCNTEILELCGKDELQFPKCFVCRCHGVCVREAESRWPLPVKLFCESFLKTEFNSVPFFPKIDII
jgi:hypothetical protein